MHRRSLSITLALSVSSLGAHAFAQARLVSPQAGAWVTSHRPTLRWAGGDALIDLCRDHACSDVIATVQGHGGSATPTADLTAGRVFWRARVGSAASPVRYFHVTPRTSPVNTSWATALDVNGDGFSDVIVRGADAVAIYPGSASGVASRAMSTVRAPMDAAGYGYAVSPAGDVNGDGFGDLLVGTFSSDHAYLYLGSANGVAAAPATTLAGPGGSAFGFAVASAGDVNGDGFGDVIVGAPTGGHAYLYLGGANGLARDASVTLTTPTGAFRFGYAVAGIGDVNGDGRGDVAVGTLSNAAYVYLGGASGIPAMPTTSLPSAAADFGASVSAAGDVNGDGYADLLVGATGSSALYVFNGSANGIVSAHPTTMFGAASSWIGFAASGAGDLNNDGFADVVAANGATSVFAYAGAANGLVVAAPAATLAVPQGGEYMLTVAEGGDVNGDGFSDVVVTTRATNSTVVFLGSAGGVSTTAASTLRGPAATVTAGATRAVTPTNQDRDDQ